MKETVLYTQMNKVSSLSIKSVQVQVIENIKDFKIRPDSIRQHKTIDL